MIYCLDSSIIIWGIKKQASPGQEEMIARAESFFAKADEYNDDILIPTIVLAEILVPEITMVKARYLEILSKSFVIADFDTRAALKYAEIMYGRVSEIKDLGDSNNIPRQKMKADHMIIATAIVNNANCIYSTDPGLRTFAKGYIDIRELPPVRTQGTPLTPMRQPELFTPSDENDTDGDSPF